jgi:hypothetical protein
VESSSPEILGYYCFDQKTAQSKQSPKRRKIAQSVTLLGSERKFAEFE